VDRNSYSPSWCFPSTYDRGHLAKLYPFPEPLFSRRGHHERRTSFLHALLVSPDRSVAHANQKAPHFVLGQGSYRSTNFHGSLSMGCDCHKVSNWQPDLPSLNANNSQGRRTIRYGPYEDYFHLYEHRLLSSYRSQCYHRLVLITRCQYARFWTILQEQIGWPSPVFRPPNHRHPWCFDPYLRHISLFLLVG
jgi:hypothetical protein